jgi:hypothetical protein
VVPHCAQAEGTNEVPLLAEASAWRVRCLAVGASKAAITPPARWRPAASVPTATTVMPTTVMPTTAVTATVVAAEVCQKYP